MILRAAKTLLLLFGVVAVGACSCDEQLVVRRVLVDVDPGAVAADVDREQVRAAVSEVLGDTSGIIVDETRADGAILRVRIESFVDPSRIDPLPSAQQAGEPASLSLAVDITEGSRATLRGSSVASAPGVIDPRPLVAQALKEALRQALQTRSADKLDSSELLSWLTDTSTSTAQRKRAMQALGSRRERGATPALIALLKSEDPEVAGAALQALALLGDEDALDAIIAYSDRQPAQLRNLCIDAAKATGSPRARAWLFTLSSGHPDPTVQAHARSALAAVEVPRVAETTVR